ncbi:MBL fold metallo-hydrolase [Nocardioides marmoribigeumensis]
MLTFLGATGTVTGSRFLVEHGGERVLVDAGLYQGVKSLRERNWEAFPIDPATLRSVVLTHAHLDHCGFLPRLVRDGFDGPILCTPETAELAVIVLEDSAHLQEEDARYANQAGFSKHSPALPLYDADDVQRTRRLFVPVAFHAETEAADGVTVTLRSAGHILGSATATLEVGGSAVLFSGDLGRPRHPLVPVREDPPAADLVVVESTYGDRRHPPRSSTLADAIRRTIKRGGTVLIPAFAVDRTELVLLELGELMRTGAVPRTPVFVDSPMALAALRVYERALQDQGLPRTFGLPDLRTAASPLESEELNAPSYPCIVVSASGMASGGRVVHHLAHQLPDPRNCVVLTGYQAVGTRGRDLAEGARHVKIHGRYVPVRAEVVVDDEFSAHADADELMSWLRRMPSPPRTAFVVHGERTASVAFARRIEDELGWPAVVPQMGERVRLD